MRSTPTGGRPCPAFGYTGSISVHNSAHGTTRSISSRNSARRVFFVYRSNPLCAASVRCFIPRKPSDALLNLSSTPVENGELNQSLLSPCLHSEDSEGHDFQAYDQQGSNHQTLGAAGKFLDLCVGARVGELPDENRQNELCGEEGDSSLRHGF